MLPLESRATAHKNAADASKTSFAAGASISLPSLDNDNPVRPPLSKPARSSWVQVLVSTASAGPSVASRAAQRTTILFMSNLLDCDAQRIASAHHLIEGDG